MLKGWISVNSSIMVVKVLWMDGWMMFFGGILVGWGELTTTARAVLICVLCWFFITLLSEEKIKLLG